MEKLLNKTFLLLLLLVSLLIVRLPLYASYVPDAKIPTPTPCQLINENKSHCHKKNECLCVKDNTQFKVYGKLCDFNKNLATVEELGTKRLFLMEICPRVFLNITKNNIKLGQKVKVIAIDSKGKIRILDIYKCLLW